MRILFISNDLIGGNIAYLLKRSGHTVKLFIQQKRRRGNFQGMVNKSFNWRLDLKWVGKNGLIIFDDIGYGKLQGILRKRGYRVFGGSEKGDFLEQDRVLSQSIFNKYGVMTLPIYNFKRIDQAISFVKRNPTSWVVKQNGKEDKGLNYVGYFDDARDMIEVLKRYKENQSHHSEMITLQKKVTGVEIAATRYFNGSNWIGPTLINIEHKKLFPGDMGPTTSEMGTLGWYEKDDDNKLFQDTLKKIEPYLRDIDYRGIIDINCIVNEKGTFPLEATCRIGSPIVHLQSSLNKSTWYELMRSIAEKKEFNLEYTDEFCIVIVIAIPPFPYSKHAKDHSQIGTPVFFDDSMTDEDLAHIHFEDVALNRKERQYHVSDSRGYILYVTGTGITVKKARKMAYRIAKMIHVPKMFYRNDIGLSFINSSQRKLKRWGYIK